MITLTLVLLHLRKRILCLLSFPFLTSNVCFQASLFMSVLHAYSRINSLGCPFYEEFSNSTCTS